MTRAWRVGLACGLVGALTLRTADAQQPASSPVPAAARPTRTTAVAGVHYTAGWFHRWLLGTHYRDLWATSVEVEQLDLSRFAGGLTPTGCGGRRQTKVLRLLGADGRQYVFRSIDKDPTLALPPELRATFAKDVIQDQISSAHPGAPLVVAPLLGATGVLHAEPQLTELPSADARLAGFDCVRPGFLLGMIEERPTEPPDNDVGFAGAVELAGTKKLFEYLERDARNRVDSRAFLAARLMDVFIGDWDRHQDQWRWARFDVGDIHLNRAQRHWSWWRSQSPMKTSISRAARKARESTRLRASRSRYSNSFFVPASSTAPAKPTSLSGGSVGRSSIIPSRKPGRTQSNPASRASAEGSSVSCGSAWRTPVAPSSGATTSGAPGCAELIWS